MNWDKKRYDYFYTTIFDFLLVGRKPENDFFLFRPKVETKMGLIMMAAPNVPCLVDMYVYRIHTSLGPSFNIRTRRVPSY